MAVSSHHHQLEYGVVNLDGCGIKGFEEKPTLQFFVNAGIYVLKPNALDQLVPEAPIDMPELFENLRAKGCKTVAYKFDDSWHDIGRPEDLATMNDSTDDDD